MPSAQITVASTKEPNSDSANANATQGTKETKHSNTTCFVPPKGTSRVEAANAEPLHRYTYHFTPSLATVLAANATFYTTSPPSQPTFNDVTKHGNLRLTLFSSSTLSRSLFGGCFNLLEASSKADYVSSSTGWKPASKKREMKLPDMRYIVVRPIGSDKVPVDDVQGFASFMMTYEDGIEVVYLYEVHITPQLQGNGLGRRLMELVENAGRLAGMKKAMLTVFAANQKANKFYERLGYVVDEYSPAPKRLRGGAVKMPHYSILSKRLEASVRHDDERKQDIDINFSKI